MSRTDLPLNGALLRLPLLGRRVFEATPIDYGWQNPGDVDQPRRSVDQIFQPVTNVDDQSTRNRWDLHPFPLLVAICVFFQFDVEAANAIAITQ